MLKQLTAPQVHDPGLANSAHMNRVFYGISINNRISHLYPVRDAAPEHVAV